MSCQLIDFDVAGLITEAFSNYLYTEHTVMTVDTDDCDDSDDDCDEMKEHGQVFEVQCGQDLCIHASKETLVVEDQVLIEDTEDERVVCMNEHPPVLPSFEIKMLMAPPLDIAENLWETRQHLLSLLTLFRQEVVKTQNTHGIVLEGSFALPEPSGTASSISPAEPEGVIGLHDDDMTSDCPCLLGIATPTDRLEADMLTHCEGCSLALSKFKSEVALYEESHRRLPKNEVLMHEELGGIEKHQAIDEHWSTGPLTCKSARLEKMRFAPKQLEDVAVYFPDVVQSWVAGSPASAARQMRRSVPKHIHKENTDCAVGNVPQSNLTIEFDGFGALPDRARIQWTSSLASLHMGKLKHGSNDIQKQSAMSLDLASGHLSCNQNVLRKAPSSRRSRRMRSMGAVKVTKTNVPSSSLKSLGFPKPSRALSAPSLHNAAGDLASWSMEPHRSSQCPEWDISIPCHACYTEPVY
jgi:hypothetical protein